MLAILAESALRSLLLGGVVWAGLNLFRVQNPHMHMTSWAMVLLASLSMPLLMHWTTVTVTLDALPVPAAEHFWPAGPSGSPSPEPLTDMLAAGPRRQADARALDRRLERAREQRDRRPRHLRLDHPASAAMLRLGCAQA